MLRIVKLLLRHGASAQYVSRRRFSVLEPAVALLVDKESRYQIFSILLARGANPKLRSTVWDNTVLHSACAASNDIRIVNALLKAGADKSAPSRSGMTPLNQALRSTGPERGAIVAQLQRIGAAATSDARLKEITKDRRRFEIQQKIRREREEERQRRRAIAEAERREARKQARLAVELAKQREEDRKRDEENRQRSAERSAEERRNLQKLRDHLTGRNRRPAKSSEPNRYAITPGSAHGTAPPPGTKPRPRANTRNDEAERRRRRMEQWRRENERRKAQAAAVHDRQPSGGLRGGAVGGRGVNRTTTVNYCARLRQRWGGGPSLNMPQPAPTPRKVVRVREKRRHELTSFPTKEQSCAASYELAFERAMTKTCRQKGGQYDGKGYRKEFCGDCKIRGKSHWCWAEVSIGCVITRAGNLEIEMRRRIVGRLLANAFQSVEGMLETWTGIKTGQGTDVPAGSFISIGTELRSFKRKAPQFRRRIAEATSGLELNRIADQIKSSISSLNSDIRSCR